MSLPPKPKRGSPCNGCGICCAVELCVVGELAFPGASAPCPALKLRGDGKSTYCQLVAVEIADGLEPMLQEALGIGKGCSMPDDDQGYPRRRSRYETESPGTRSSMNVP